MAVTVRDRRSQVRTAIGRVPVLDRAVRRLGHTTAVVGLNSGRPSLGERCAAAFAPKAHTVAEGPRSGDGLGLLIFQCNICAARNKLPMADMQRETGSCKGCGSSVRCRGVIHALSTTLFDHSLSIPHFPVRPDIVGCGLSDWEGYAKPLARKFSYTNTFYHAEPFLDITDILPSRSGTVDFLISSDVFEHVRPPVKKAFENSRRLLKPNGALILTVPYGLQPKTIEHFPNFYDFTIVGEGEGRQALNITAGGVHESFSDLVFHGGAGNTLEMRVFSQDDLLSDLQEAGFSRVTIRSDPCFEHGVFWRDPWSLPIVACP